MALLNRERPNNIIPPPQAAPTLNTPSRHRWPVLLIYGLGALVVAILLVFGGRWVYRSVANNNPSPSPPTQISQNYPSQSTQQPQKSPNPSPPSKSPSPAPAPSPSSLPNNGPGEVITLFFGTSLLAAWLHYRFIASKNPD